MPMIAWVLAVLCLGCSLGQQAPGAKVTITQGGLTYLKDVGVTVLLQQLGTINIPSQSGDQSTPIGSVSYSLTDIVLTNLAIPSSELTTVSGSGLQVTATGASCVVNLNWSYREDAWPHVSDSGSATVDIGSTSVTIQCAVGENNGRPTLITTLINVGIGSFSVNVHGGAGWLYDFIVGLFQGQLQTSVQNTLASQIASQVNIQAANVLNSLPLEMLVSREASIDYAETSAAYFSSTFLTSPHLAMFVSNQGQAPPPWNPANMADTVSSGRMMEVLLTPSVAMSAGYVFYHAGLLQCNVTSLPSNAPFQLNTYSFRDEIPALYQMYPNMSMSVHFVANNTPNVGVQYGIGLATDVTGNAEVYVVARNGTEIPVFELGMHLFGAATVSVNNMNVTARARFVNSTLSLVNSNVGEIDVVDFQALVNFACTYFLIPYLNILLGVGFTLPTVAGLSLSNPNIEYQQGYVAIVTDVNYNTAILMELAEHDVY